jgi:hypothetical protein
MFTKFTSAILVAALFIGLCGTSAFAGISSTSSANADVANLTVAVPEKKEAQPNPELKSKINKLVEDARAGKVVPAAKSEIQPAKSNNWSTGTKVAVGIGIAVAVVAVVVIVQAKKGPSEGIRIF